MTLGARLISVVLLTAAAACTGVVQAVRADDGTGGGAETDGGAATDGGATTDGGTSWRTIHYLGRYDFRTPGEAAFEWSGSGLDARFVGTAVAARLKSSGVTGGTGYFEVVIDDDEAFPMQVTFDGGSASLLLATGLDAGTHQVELYRRTEASMGEQRFLGFTVTGGTLIASPPPFAKKIEFIGDSITAGYGDEGTSRACSFSYATENEYRTYAALTARALSAERHVIAWSGIGMYRAYHEATSVDQMPVLYERTLPTDPESRWDFTRWIPDVVVINLGTNDYWSSDPNNDPSQPYTAAYLVFLEKLRGRYPQAEVLCAMGTMSDDARWKAALQSIVARRNAAGDQRVHFLQFAMQRCDPPSNCGCDWHPNLATHQAMADTLVATIRALTGW